MKTVPSAASFYVPSLPDLHQDASRPLRMYAGHLSSDPDAGVNTPQDVTAHLYFFMVKARRTADKERIVFWLNVSTSLDWIPPQPFNISASGWPGMFIL